MKRLLLVILVLMRAVGCVSKPKFDVSRYIGIYVGTWTNSATGASGAARIEITADEKTRKASLTLDFGGNYLGLGDPPAANLEGVFDDTQAIARGQSPLFGDYDFTIDAAGNIVGVMKNLGNGAIPEMVYTGQLTG